MRLRHLVWLGNRYGCEVEYCGSSGGLCIIFGSFLLSAFFLSNFFRSVAKMLILVNFKWQPSFQCFKVLFKIIWHNPRTLSKWLWQLSGYFVKNLDHFCIKYQVSNGLPTREWSPRLPRVWQKFVGGLWQTYLLPSALRRSWRFNNNGTNTL